MPLAELNRVVLFAHEISLIQPRLLTDEFFARFRWSCLSSLKKIIFRSSFKGLIRADLNETSSVWLFATPKETIKEIKMRIGGGRKIEILGSGGPRIRS